MSDHSIAIRQESDLQPATSPLGLFAEIMRIAEKIDTAKLKDLLDANDRVSKEQQRISFQGALSRLTKVMPQMDKYGQSHHGKYSRLDDIDKIIRPLMADEGFALSFDTQPIEGNRMRIVCKLSHEDGHYETKQIDLPIDNSGSKNGAQAVGSTVSYGRRMLTKMFFNIVEKGEDTDANDLAPISEEQARELHILINDSKSDKVKFLKFMGVETVEQIPQKDLAKAVKALQMKMKK